MLQTVETKESTLYGQRVFSIAPMMDWTDSLIK